MAMPASSRIVDVAEQILSDIRRRQLRPGEAYLGTAETARLFRISGSTVNRAFQLLARRGVVQRRQRRGTIVLDPDRRGDSQLQRVHLLVRKDHLKAEGLWADGVLMGLQEELPGVQLQFNFRPESDDADYLRGLIDDILRSNQTAGLVLIRSNVQTQRLVAGSGLPAVVSGTLQPSIAGIPSIDRDQRQIGALLADYLLRAGCRHFLVLMRERMAAGDHLMLDAALKTLAGAQVPLDRIKLRFLPSDPEAIAAEMRDLLLSSPARAGCVCRSERLARGVEDAAAGLRLSARDWPQLVVADAARQRYSESRFPCIEPDIAAEEWGARLGRVLLAAARGEHPQPEHQLIPVHLWEPEKKV